MKRSLASFAAAMGGVLFGADVSFGEVSIDSRTCGHGDLFFALNGERFDGHDFLSEVTTRGVAGVVVSRPVDLSIPQILVSDTLIALQRAGAAWRDSFDIPVIGVAGSNGKTTTKEMIRKILSQVAPTLATKGTLNNHIGVPLTLLGLHEQHWSAVIEIGANHPGEVAALTSIASPTVGVVTNAGAEHLEGFGSLEGAARAEGEIFAGLKPSATAIINSDDPFAGLWESMNHAGSVKYFGSRIDAEYRQIGDLRMVGQVGEIQEFQLVTPSGMKSVKLALVGRHNIQNALAAAAAAHVVGCDLAQISAGLEQVLPVKGRLEVKQAMSGGCIIDDSYNANPSSLEAGLNVLAAANGERWMVLGNMAELGADAENAHRQAGRSARAAGVSRLFALGDLAIQAAEAFGSGAEHFAESAELANRLSRAVVPGVTLLVKGSRVNKLERVVDALVNPTVLGG